MCKIKNILRRTRKAYPQEVHQSHHDHQIRFVFYSANEWTTISKGHSSPAEPNHVWSCNRNYLIISDFLIAILSDDSAESS